MQSRDFCDHLPTIPIVSMPSFLSSLTRGELSTAKDGELHSISDIAKLLLMMTTMYYRFCIPTSPHEQ